MWHYCLLFFFFWPTSSLLYFDGYTTSQVSSLLPFLKRNHISWVERHIPENSAFRRLRHRDNENEASWGYIVRTCLKTNHLQVSPYWFLHCRYFWRHSYVSSQRYQGGYEPSFHDTMLMCGPLLHSCESFFFSGIINLLATPLHKALRQSLLVIFSHYCNKVPARTHATAHSFTEFWLSAEKSSSAHNLTCQEAGKECPCAQVHCFCVPLLFCPDTQPWDCVCQPLWKWVFLPPLLFSENTFIAIPRGVPHYSPRWF